MVYKHHIGTQRNNDMLVINSREFRQNQKMYFESADQGEQIIVQRGKDKSYALTPVGEDDLYFNADYSIKEEVVTVYVVSAYSHDDNK